MKKTTKKYLSFVLATVMVFLLVSTSTTALDVTDNSSADFTENSTPPQDVVIPNPDYVADDSQSKVIEITALRDENVKHFQLPDGTMQAVAFPTAIHEKDAEGKWQPIDSSVSLKSIRGVDVYTTKNGTTRFASSVTNNSPLFTISENGYVIEVSLENFLSSNLVHTTDAARRVVVSSAEPVKTAEWQSVEDAISSVSINSVVRYESVYPYTDIEYTVTKDAVKENIVIKSVEGTTVYKFKYQLTGLIAALNDNGSISLLDKETKKLEYEIPSPYMYDSNGEFSRDVHYTLSETAKGTYIITVTADEEWLSAEARAYPVVIDPSISSSRVVWDTFVNSADPDQTYGDWGVWVGPSYTGLARNNMPTLPSGAVVTSGKLNVYYYFLSGVTGSRVIGAYKMTKSWSEMNDSYNSLKNRYGDSLGISTTLLSTATAFASSGITSSNPRKITFDVTSAVSSWYSGDSNYGIALKHYSGTPQATDGTNTGTIIKNFETYSDYRMYYTIAYTIPNGVYAIEKADTNVYVKNNTLDELAWVFQEPFASSPINESDRDYMFKITYRPSTDDYVIRSMSNNEIIIYPSVYNNAPVAGRVTVSGAPATDSNISTAYTWKMTTTSDGYDYIWYKENGTTYYMRSTSNEGSGPILSFTTNQYNVGTKWSFHRYTGDPIDGIGRLNFERYLNVGDTYTHRAYMYSSTIGRNGPVSYSSADSSIISVTSSSGVVTAVAPGDANIWVTYPHAPRLWGRTTTVKSYSASVYMFYDKGYYVRYGETEATARANLNSYINTIANRYYELLGLRITTNGATYYNSAIDSCKSNVSSCGTTGTNCGHNGTSCNINALCSHLNPHTILFNSTNSVSNHFNNNTSPAGSNTVTKAYWSGHRIKTYSNVEEYNRCYSSGTSIYMLELSTASNRTQNSKGILMHELNHQYGAPDHYHEILDIGTVNERCRGGELCSDCGSNPRPNTCIMYRSRIDITVSTVICPGCKADMYLHLAGHH